MIVLKSDRGIAWATNERVPWQLNRAASRSLGVAKTPLCGGVGGFASDNYWSSGENNATNAWIQNFNNGNQNNDNKSNTNHVRPVRGFRHDNDLWAAKGRIAHECDPPLPASPRVGEPLIYATDTVRPRAGLGSD